jgi:diacylglycerol kinase
MDPRIQQHEPIPSVPMLNSRPARSWREKFRDAFRGVKEGTRSQTSFLVHFSFTAAAVIAAAAMRMDGTEWSILLLCITVVLTVEMFNSALESLARAITSESNSHVGNALDIGSAAVLVASLGAAIVGTLVFLHRLASVLGWW